MNAWRYSSDSYWLTEVSTLGAGFSLLATPSGSAPRLIALATFSRASISFCSASSCSSSACSAFRSTFSFPCRAVRISSFLFLISTSLLLISILLYKNVSTMSFFLSSDSFSRLSRLSIMPLWSRASTLVPSYAGKSTGLTSTTASM